MTYLSPLAYLIGLEGVALLRGMREGTGDQDFVEARIAEIRAMLENPALREAGGIDSEPGGISTDELYSAWAASYDGPNSMIDSEQPLVRAILADLPVGTALDAACGTGRHAQHLAELGHQVIGVDANTEMLAVAAKKLPGLDLRRGGLDALPLGDDSVDVITCGLALCHVPDLDPVFAEFARVSRPGGHLVISDPHQLLSYLRPTSPRDPRGDGQPGILEEYHRPLSAYLASALPLGFELRHCAEPHPPRGDATGRPAFARPMPAEVGWDLIGQVPAASVVALDIPTLVIMHLQWAP